jgi:phage shock protein A
VSTTPLIPENTSDRLKSFWKRPEGKVGMGVLAALAILAIANGVAITTYVLTMLDNVWHIAILLAELAGLLYLCFGKLPRLVFRLTMRWITGFFIELDPIGILKDHISQMTKRLAEMREQITNVSGQIGVIKNIMAKNKKDAADSLAKAEEAKRQAAATTDPNRRTAMNLQMQGAANHAARVTAANQNYQQLLTKLQTIYDILVKWADHIDFFIDDTNDQVRQAEVQYKALNAGSSAMRKAMKVIGGNSFEDETYNQTMEFLADQAGRQLGEMENFQAVAQKFMDGIDIENGVAQTQALAQLDAFEQKLLTPGNPDTAFLKSGPEKQAIPINRAATGTDDYGSDILKY